MYSDDLWCSTAPPGACAYHYSNAGFTLLGLVLSKATARPLQDLARERIFTPLGMIHTSYSAGTLPPTASAVEPTILVDGKHQSLGAYEVAEFPACQVWSTSEDLAKWLVAYDSPDVESILSLSSIEEMMPASFTDGLGWWGKDIHVRDYELRQREGGDFESSWSGFAGKEGWCHGGFMEGVRSHLYHFPGQRAGMVFLASGEGDYVDIEKLMLAVIDPETQHWGPAHSQSP